MRKILSKTGLIIVGIASSFLYGLMYEKGRKAGKSDKSLLSIAPDFIAGNLGRVMNLKTQQHQGTDIVGARNGSR